MPSTVDDEPPPPGESLSPAASSPSRAAAAALSSPSVQADLPMSPGRAAAAAIMRGISGMIGAALSPAIRRHPPTELVVGATPFDGSLVESTISHSEEMAEKILQEETRSELVLGKRD